MAKRFLAGMYAIPFVGYFVRLCVAFVKLPLINARVWRIDQEGSLHKQNLAVLYQRFDALQQQCRKLETGLREQSASLGHGHVELLQQHDALEASWSEHPTALHQRTVEADQRYVELRQRHDALEASWHQHVPAFLNAVSSIGAFGYQLARQDAGSKARDDAVKANLDRLGNEIAALQTAAVRPATIDIEAALQSEDRHIHDLMHTAERHWHKIGEVEQRLEMVRREIMLEMRYGAGQSMTPLVTPTRVVNASALAVDDLRLNLGCGHVPLTGFVNVDARDLPGVDVVATLDNLPVDPGTVAEILLAHVLEHFPQDEVRLKLLPYWVELLRPGGEFRAIVPDAETMIAASASGTYSFEDFREVFFGGQEYAGDFHFNMFTPQSLAQLLEQGGLSDVEVLAAGRRNGRCFEFEIRGRRRPTVSSMVLTAAP